jgi:hypothetical protein
VTCERDEIRPKSIYVCFGGRDNDLCSLVPQINKSQEWGRGEIMSKFLIDTDLHNVMVVSTSDENGNLYLFPSMGKFYIWVKIKSQITFTSVT